MTDLIFPPIVDMLSLFCFFYSQLQKFHAMANKRLKCPLESQGQIRMETPVNKLETMKLTAWRIEEKLSIFG